MSKIGKKIIKIPDDVSVFEEENKLVFKNNKGELRVPILNGVKYVIENKNLHFELLERSKIARSNWGTFAALSINAINGLSKEFEKKLILEGVGYRVTKEGEGLIMNLGFSHPISYASVPGISFEVEKNSILVIKGNDKHLVGHVASKIRSMKKPEPYKGKGFRYDNEVIRRKAGKKSGTSSK